MHAQLTYNSIDRGTVCSFVNDLRILLTIQQKQDIVEIHLLLIIASVSLVKWKIKENSVQYIS